MSLAASNALRNHRGLYFEFVGDGSTAQITVPHGAHHRGARTATVFAVTGGSAPDRHSGKGGFSFPTGGTTVSATVTVNSDSTVTVTTSPAVANGTRAFVAVVFNDDSN